MITDIWDFDSNEIQNGDRIEFEEGDFNNGYFLNVATVVIDNGIIMRISRSMKTA